MSRHSHRNDMERGATLVEFALITPLLFLLLGSMLDIGLAVLGRSVASNAAREGARVGIIKYVDADQPGLNRTAIVAAVQDKLVGLVKPDPAAAAFVEVRCLDGGTKLPLAGTGTCAKSQVRIDYDLIEVTVRWASVSPAGGIFTPDSYADRARMVITGDVNGGSSCSIPGGVVNISPTARVIDEGNGPGTLTVDFTITRSNSTCTTTVDVSTADGTAVAPDDYLSVANTLVFGPGESSKSVSVEIVGDTVFEGPEVFTVNLSNIGNGTPGAVLAAVTINNDDISSVPPTLSYLRQYDLDADGRIDRITAGFDEDLQPVCPSPSAFTFPGNPNGVSVSGAIVFSGIREVTLNLNEGTADTSDSAVTVALAAGCVRDVDGNSATFAATSPTDLAPPVLLTVVDDDTANNSANGTFQRNDWVEFTFSEPLNPGTLGLATTDVALLGGNGSANDSVRMPGLLNSDINLGSNSYTTQSNGQANFLGSTVAFSNGNRTIRVTLVSACSGSGQNCNRVAQGGQANVTFVFVTTLRALDGLPISSGPISVRLF